MQNTNYVFLNADDAAIVVTVNKVVVGAAYTAAQLAALFTANNINVSTDTIMCSSSIDFAQEEGFDTDDCAHALIDSALAQL
jgi:hypothetical protein